MLKNRVVPWGIFLSLLATASLTYANTSACDTQFNGFITSKVVSIDQSDADDDADFFGPVAVAIGPYFGTTYNDRIVVSTNDDDSLVTIYPGSSLGSIVQVFIPGMKASSLTLADFGNGLAIAVAGAASDTDSYNGQGMIQIIESDNDDGALGPTYYLDDIASFNGIASGLFNFNVTAGPFSSPADAYSLALTGVDLSSQNGYVYIYIGNDDYTFTYGSSVQVGQFPIGIAAGQTQDDSSFYDLLVANYDDSTVSLLNGAGDNTFTLSQTYTTSAQPVAVAFGNLSPEIGDLDSVNLYAEDFAVISVDTFHAAEANTKNVVDIFLNNGLGYDFTQLTAIDLTAIQSTGFINPAIAIGNLANHSTGIEDIVVTNDGGIQLIINDGYNNFTLDPTGYATGTNPSSIAVGDLNKDSYNDVFIGNQSNYTVNSLYQNIYAPCMDALSAKVSYGHKKFYNVYLSWTPTSGSIGTSPVDHYILSRNGKVINANINVNTGSYVDTNLLCGEYVYTLTAVSVSHLTSVPSTLTVDVSNNP